MRSREAAILDRLSAQRMHLPRWVALTAGPAPITLRFKLARLGLSDETPEVAELLQLVDEVETQRMLKSQSISTRFSAVERDLPRRRVWR
jgi:hypothetical protein